MGQNSAGRGFWRTSSNVGAQRHAPPPEAASEPTAPAVDDLCGLWVVELGTEARSASFWTPSPGGDSGESPSASRRELFFLSNPAQVRVLRKSAPAPVVVTLSASARTSGVQVRPLDRTKQGFRLRCATAHLCLRPCTTGCLRHPGQPIRAGRCRRNDNGRFSTPCWRLLGRAPPWQIRYRA